MPSTINGIGTHYYGKKNLVTRAAPCGSCHRLVNLESFDTRLWFVVVFIPVIPLGRKRIIDKCPSCTRHMAADLDKYEQSKQLQTSGSLERFRREPSTDAALGAHAQFLSFHEYDEAARFRGTALERFPGHPGLRAGLASHLAQVGSHDEAARLFEEALKLDPGLPEARIGVARRRMAEGQLDEARRLLDFLERPGAGRLHPLGALDSLSSYYQNQGRHQEALEIAGHLLREIPEAGGQHAFRSFVRKSEKALGRPDSILPPAGHSLRGLFRAEGSPYAPWQRKLVLGSAAAALLAAGLLISNEYIRTHRTIHVLNATGGPVRVQVDGGPAREVSGLGSLVVGEGPHRLSVAGPEPESHDVEVRSGYFERWTHKPAWVLNPGGEAVIGESTIHYAAMPAPSETRVVVGRPFSEWPHVDYPFESPPSSMKVKGKNTTIDKTALEWIQGSDDQAFQAGLESDRAAALGFAERRLRRDPSRWALLKSYLTRTGPEESPRVEALLRSRLDRRPPVVNWHRAYQSVAGRPESDDALVKLYDGFLAAEPASAPLLYLRGRVDPDLAAQERYFRRSIEADPAFPWPRLALGVGAAARASWPEALALFREAVERKIEPEFVADYLHVARLATGDAAALAEEYRARSQSSPPDPSVPILLADALAASGHPDQIDPAVVACVNRLPGEVQGMIGRPLRAYAAYQAGDPAEADALCREAPPSKAGALRAQALAAEGKAGEAVADPGFERAWADPWAVLAMALGLDLEGKPEEAARWREKAAKGLESRSLEDRRAARVLGSAGPPAVDEVARVLMEPGEKALAFAVLARKFPEKRDEYRAEAGRYNIRRIPPYLLVRRAIEAPAPAAP